MYGDETTSENVGQTQVQQEGTKNMTGSANGMSMNFISRGIFAQDTTDKFVKGFWASTKNASGARCLLAKIPAVRT